MAQRIVARVFSLQHLFAGKYKWELHVGNELRDMRHLYMGLWYFLYKENFHYFPEGALEVLQYRRVVRAKREPKYPLFDFVEAAKAMGDWVGIKAWSRLLR